MTKELRKGRNVVHLLTANIVFINKYKGDVFNCGAINKIEELMKKICVENDISLKQFIGGSDYVHLVIA